MMKKFTLIEALVSIAIVCITAKDVFEKVNPSDQNDTDTIGNYELHI